MQKNNVKLDRSADLWTLYIIDDSNPWTVMRAAELLNWIKEGEYERVMIMNEQKTDT